MNKKLLLISIIFLVLILLSACKIEAEQTTPINPTQVPTSTVEPTPTIQRVTSTPLPQICTGMNVSDLNINIRSGPGTQYEVLDIFSPESKVIIVGRNEDLTWLKLENAQYENGWIYAELLELSGGCAEIPFKEYNVLPTTVSSSLTPISTVTSISSSAPLEITSGQPTYIYDTLDRLVMAEIDITVKNISVQNGISTGYTYTEPNPDGGTQYVTSFGAIHKEVPQADIVGSAPLWRGNVKFSDGSTYWFPAGCLYIETIDAEGWEPTGPDTGFNWSVHWTGGFFDCGNSTHKLPQTSLIMPGQEVTIPLYVYFVHPRLWDDSNYTPVDRDIESLGVEVFDSQGHSLGTFDILR